MTYTSLLLKRPHNSLSNTFVTANMTSLTHNIASSTWFSRMLVTAHFECFSGLSTLRHQVLPTPTYDLLDTTTAPQLLVATIIRFKSVSSDGYRELFKLNNIVDFIVSPFSTLTFYYFVALLAFYTKTVTLYTAYALAFAISLGMILETYNTIYALLKRIAFTSERVRPNAAYLFCATGPLGLVVFSFGMGPGSGHGYEYSPGVDCMRKEDNATKDQQHREERSASETKVRLYNDLFREDHHALKADENIRRQQDNAIRYVLDTTPRHESSKAQPATYKSLTPGLNTGQESDMKTAKNHLSLTTPEIHSRESPFQMTLRKSMHRRKEPRRTRSRMSIPVKECSSEDSRLKEGFRVTVWSEDAASGEISGMSTPESECSTPESEFQAGLRMMFGSACGKGRRGRRGSKTGPSIAKSEYSSQESEFQTKFRKAVWPRTSSKRRTGASRSEISSEESDFQAEFRAMMGLGGGKRKIF